MPIALNCPGCKTSYKIPDKFIGKDIQCKKCPQTISVVDEAEEEAAAEEAKRIARNRKR
ncbi:hypothetical protein KIH39_05975 [Telmatocola sphagniphila]|uniref:Uncharacterized protein n=1 Tax=Telmatocola sphagniphila TaxID=1123043 RepID=A0A8E6EZ79_9BACT|nr:hypothetical protein KIH39_05975 [Telmatocola sphagniphila]